MDVTGRVHCWGYSGYSRIVGTPASGGWESASAGARHSCAVSTNGRRECWGYGQWTGLGLTGVVDVDAGLSETCLLRFNSGLGHDAIECLDGSYGAYWSGLNQNNGNSWWTRYVDMALYSAHVCAITDAGEIDCWGRNNAGQTNSPGGSNYLQVATGSAHSCALDSANDITCWGDSSDEKTSAPDYGMCFRAEPMGPIFRFFR